MKIGAVEVELLQEIARRGIADADSYDYRPTPGTLLAIAALAEAGLRAAPPSGDGRFVERANGSIVSRASDYDPTCGLRLARAGGGDLTVTTLGEVIFAGPGGGGRSPKTRLALLALFAAMEADAADASQPPSLIASPRPLTVNARKGTVDYGAGPVPAPPAGDSA